MTTIHARTPRVVDLLVHFRGPLMDGGPASSLGPESYVSPGPRIGRGRGLAISARSAMNTEEFHSVAHAPQLVRACR
jgi:hypothetical protein